MERLLDRMNDFIVIYHNEYYLNAIDFLGGAIGYIFTLVFIWVCLYAIGFSVARHKKSRIDGVDIIGSFFFGGLAFMIIASLLFWGAAFISLIIAGIIIFGVPASLLYFGTGVVLKGLDIRKSENKTDKS